MIALRPETGNRFSIMGRVAFVDLSSWVLPLVVLALSARQLGIAKRFSPYVVASNWGTAIGAWLMVPATLARLLLARLARLGHRVWPCSSTAAVMYLRPTA